MKSRLHGGRLGGDVDKLRVDVCDVKCCDVCDMDRRIFIGCLSVL